MSYIKTEDGHVYDESKTLLSTFLGTRVVQVSDEIEPLLECFILRDGDGNQKIVEVCFDEKVVSAYGKIMVALHTTN